MEGGHAPLPGSAWDPGVSSKIPRHFLALETIRRAECVFPESERVEELCSFTGLAHEELVRFRPSRLALHEVIVRVTADIAVPEGRTEELFGQNFRRIAGNILSKDVAPCLERFEQIHAALGERVNERVRAILAERLDPPPEAARPASIFGRWFKPKPAMGGAGSTSAELDHQVVTGFRTEGLAASDVFERALFRSLYRVLGAVLAARGRLGADRGLLTEVVTRHVCNTYGSRLIGAEIEALVATAIEREGYPRVPIRAAPVLVSLKGPSAAGKSSIRPMVKRLMHDSEIEPDGYATISPDVWRRLLLDYEALGDAYKYAGHLTSREVMVIDAKLDRYIRDQARRVQAIPHLLVDRFRFDSFSTQEVGRVLQSTYARYVSAIHMYFIVTPPEETVERGWLRALERGRYKAVEDFLGHCVEAYSGMPSVFFRWLGYTNADFRYYFLDNRVPIGEFPTPIATGDRSCMSVFDPEGLVNIDRYQKININARCREEVYPDGDAMAVRNNLGFLRQCLRAIAQVRFHDGPDGRPYLECSKGSFRVLDRTTLETALQRASTRDVLTEIAPGLFTAEGGQAGPPSR